MVLPLPALHLPFIALTYVFVHFDILVMHQCYSILHLYLWAFFVARFILNSDQYRTREFRFTFFFLFFCKIFLGFVVALLEQKVRIGDLTWIVTLKLMYDTTEIDDRTLNGKTREQKFGWNKKSARRWYANDFCATALKQALSTRNAPIFTWAKWAKNGYKIYVPNGWLLE